MSDAIRTIASLAEEWGLELQGLISFLELRSVHMFKIGRTRCVRVSDVLAAVERPAVATQMTQIRAASPLDALAERIRKGA